MSPADLAELLGAFNDATSKLQAAHESLGAEVVRLRRELSEANQQLERSRRLAALGEMAAGIAHEIRNPLGSIRLYAQMLESDLAAAGRDTESGLARRIAGAVRTVDAVVRDVLAFAGDARVRPQPVSIGELLDRAIEESLAAVPINASVRRLDRESGASEIEIMADPALMHRAIVNISCNALQAMAESSSAAPMLTIEASVRGETPVAWVRISDTGPGIPSELMDRIFNPFFTTRATGTGLGLAIVHRIVDAHGGRTTVKNVVDPSGSIAGAAIELELPLGGPDQRCLELDTPAAAPESRAARNTQRRPGATVVRSRLARVTEDAR